VAAISHHAYAEYDVADEHALVRIPGPLAASPFPGEPLGCAINICERSRVERGHTVAIIGIGFLGALLTRLYSNRGARVIAISKRAFSLSLARTMGASETIPLHDHDQVVEQVQALTQGALCPRVVEATGKPWPLDLAGDIAATRGTVVIAGYHQDGPRQINMQLWNWKGLDIINAHEREASKYVHGMRRALSAIESRELDPLPLYTHRYGLEDLGQALQVTHDRPDGFIKALVMP
jgi:threonine dehydrogenase-like Zn-dependent dehydrogenase